MAVMNIQATVTPKTAERFINPERGVICPDCNFSGYLVRIDKTYKNVKVRGWHCNLCDEDFADLSEIEKLDGRVHGK